MIVSIFSPPPPCHQRPSAVYCCVKVRHERQHNGEFSQSEADYLDPGSRCEEKDRHPPVGVVQACIRYYVGTSVSVTSLQNSKSPERAAMLYLLGLAYQDRATNCSFSF